MIIRKEINGVKYEAVLSRTLDPSGEVQQYQIIVHDPNGQGGRRQAFLCTPEQVPSGHVVIGTLAIK